MSVSKQIKSVDSPKFTRSQVFQKFITRSGTRKMSQRKDAVNCEWFIPDQGIIISKHKQTLLTLLTLW